jgi:biotin carboxyl carrier protein
VKVERPIQARLVGAGRQDDDLSLVVDAATRASIEWLDPEHAILAEAAAGEGSREVRTRLAIGRARRMADGTVVREVVVDGWRFEVELDDARRISLRARASRAASAVGRVRRLEVRSDLPGRVVRVAVAPGDTIVAGQELLVIEAMKMHNEVRATSPGTVARVAVAPGDAVELGDLLVLLD